MHVLIVLASLPAASYATPYIFWSLFPPARTPESWQDESGMDVRMLSMTHALLLASLLYLSAAYHGPSVATALRVRQWSPDLFAGALFGAFWFVAFGLVVRSPRADLSQLAQKRFRRGSLTFWIPALTLGSLVEELWRAQCLTQMTSLPLSSSTSVVVSTVFFVGAHPRLRLGGFIRVALFGLVAAILYLRFGSVVAPFTAHLVANLSALYWIRQVSLPKRPPPSVSA